MVIIDVGSPKMAREYLCRLQSLVMTDSRNSYTQNDIRFLSDLINRIDEHRPLGIDGKHGDLHTPTCGCDPETVEEFLQKKTDRKSNGNWETTDGDYSLVDSVYFIESPSKFKVFENITSTELVEGKRTVWSDHSVTELYRERISMAHPWNEWHEAL